LLTASAYSSIPFLSFPSGILRNSWVRNFQQKFNCKSSLVLLFEQGQVPLFKGTLS
jgi:hypothetical protein